MVGGLFTLARSGCRVQMQYKGNIVEKQGNLAP